MLSILETDNASFLTFLLGQSDDPSLNIKKNPHRIGYRPEKFGEEM